MIRPFSYFVRCIFMLHLGRPTRSNTDFPYVRVFLVYSRLLAVYVTPLTHCLYLRVPPL